MADKKISQLSSATTPLAGTEVLPIVQSGSTVKVATDDLTVKNVRSNATTGILQVAGPGAGTTRTMTVPNANFTAARTDAAQTFTGTQTFSSNLSVAGLSVGAGGGGLVTNAAVGGSALSANVTGNQNVAVGRFALLANTTDDNTAVGFASLYSVVSGNQNSAVGSSALFNATGIQNTAIGTNAGSNATTGNNNGFFGYNAQPSSVTVSNEYTYGNSSVTKHRFPGGDLVVGTAGKGIDFSANSHAAGMTSELLDWYEEGTWTAVISDGTTDATMGDSTCQYTRVGRQVTVCGYISTTDITGITGNLLIKGLPFTISNGLSYFSSGSIGGAGNLNISANQVLSIYGVPNTTTADLRLWDATTGTTGLLPAEWSSDGNMVFSLTYFTAT